MPYDCCCSDARRDFPPASVCADDLFCPQCGGRVAWIRSQNALPNPDPARFRNAERVLWVYAANLGGRSFTFPIEYHGLNENRWEKPRSLEFDAARCRVEPHNWPYQFSLKKVDGDDEHQAWLRLEADPRLVGRFGESDWSNDEGLMPPGGIYCTMTLVGNFGTETLGLLVCGEPRYQIEVHEDGQLLLDAPPDGSASVRHAWAVNRRGRHQLSVAIGCVRGFVHFPGGDAGHPALPMVRASLDGGFQYGAILPPDGILGPDHDPCTITLAFDSDGWPQGELVYFDVDFVYDVLESETVRIPLYLEPRGDVGFRPNPLRIRPMFYGECERSRPEGARPAHFYHVQVFNRGERPLRLQRPVVVPDPGGPAGGDWIRVGWVDPQAELAGQVDLEVGPTMEIGVTVDLSRFTPNNHPPGRYLSATIQLESLDYDGPPWSLPVVVESVRERPELSSPLAIDFGNTNTYAVAFIEERPRAVLGGADPENFPTALYLTDVLNPDVSNVVIGSEAVRLGEKNPGALVRSLMKRWLLADDEEWHTPWTVLALNGRPHQIGRARLIGLYLERVILECEAILRRTVTCVGFSYPANFGPRARRRYDEVIKKLEDDRKERFDHLKDRIRFERISTMDSTPDEASAVAVEFVHDAERYRAKIEPHLKADRTFLVASYDFGGGSIDTALLEFTYAGQDKWLRFRSKHLSLGGDERFGGDNVTAAVGRLLIERFRELLRGVAPTAEFPVADLPESSAVGTQRWSNYQWVQALAEELKRLLCSMGGACGSTPGPGAPAGRPPSAGTGQAAPNGDSAALERLDNAIPEFLNRIEIRNAVPGQPPPPVKTAALLGPFREALRPITLQEVYAHEIPSYRDDEPPYTVYERVDRSIAELHGFVQKVAGDAPLFIVLAGAACRLPLVRERFREWFEREPPGTDLELVSWGDGSMVPASGHDLVVTGIDSNGLLRIRIFDAGGNRVTDADETSVPAIRSEEVSALKRRIPDLLPPHRPTDAEKARLLGEVKSLVGRREVFICGDPLEDRAARPKSKVGLGLARFLGYAPETVRLLSRAGRYTHGPIVWKNGPGEYVDWVPTCYPLQGDWVRLGLSLHACFRTGRIIEVYHRAHRPELIASFDLSQPATETSSDRGEVLPNLIDGRDSEVLLKVLRSEDELLLRVHYGKDQGGAWRKYGDWRPIGYTPS